MKIFKRKYLIHNRNEFYNRYDDIYFYYIYYIDYFRFYPRFFFNLYIIIERESARYKNIILIYINFFFTFNTCGHFVLLR